MVAFNAESTLLHMEHPFQAVIQLILDLLIFSVKSVFYILEALYYMILPDRFRKLKDVSGQVVLITGGGGGVGRLLALNFAKLNSRVVIWDINQEAIKTTIDLLAQNGFYNCKGYVVDICEREQVYQRAAQTVSEIGQVDILINNAGIVCCKPFWDLPDRVIQNTYNINIIAHYWTVKAFLPNMMRTRGHIVTVGSVTGMLGTYGCSDYSATKYACIGFHESLYTDLKAHGYENVQMSLICPYYINTGMFTGVKPRIFPMLEPQYVADQIVNAVRKNIVWLVLPNSIRIFSPLKCLLPAKMCWELMYRVIRGPESMMMFQGRGRVAAG